MSIQAKGVTPEWFTPHSQSDAEEPARFFLQPLTPAQSNQVMEDVDFSRYWPVGHRAVGLCLRWALKDWQGVYDTEGNLAPCTTENAATMLPPTLQQEVVSKVVRDSVLTEADRKNS